LAFVKGTPKTDPYTSDLDRIYGVSIGIAVKPLAGWLPCFRGHADHSCPHDFMTLAFSLGKARVVGGRNILKLVPPVKEVLKRDWKPRLLEEYRLAVTPNSPTNVFRREPRRHVGFIIAQCETLLLTKGVSVRKEKLPVTVKKYFKDFHVDGLLKKALWRRAHWPEISADPKQKKAALADLKSFLEKYRVYFGA
jgi:hypothetical protein